MNLEDLRLAQSLSNRQYSLLKEAERTGGLTLDRMLAISQTTAGSVVKGGALKWDDQTERFILTGDGLSMMKLFGGTDVGRNGMDRPLGKAITNRYRGLDRATEAFRTEYRTLMRREAQRESKGSKTKRANVRLKTGKGTRNESRSNRSGTEAARA